MATKNTTTSLTRKHVGDRQLRQGRGSTCRQLHHHRQRGTKPIGRRTIGILSILQALTTGEKFLRVGTGFGCLVKSLQTTDGRCEQYTHKYSTYRVAQHDHISSRVAQDSGLHIFVSLEFSSTCHVSFPAALTLTTSTSSLSPISSTSPIFPTVSPSQTSPMILNPYIRCDGSRQSDGSTQISSLTIKKECSECCVAKEKVRDQAKCAT